MQCCEALLLTACLVLPTGLLVTAQNNCALRFYFTGNRQNRVVFTGLTAEEMAASGNNTSGHRLTCACTSVEGLTPLQWLDVNGMVLPEDRARRALVDYKVAGGNQPGSAVHLRINKAGFSCDEAGKYTCVVGTNTRSVLVTPIGGECGPANVTVTASPTGPVSSGTNLTLQCSAEDPTVSGLTYEWLKNGTLISGELSLTLVLSVGPNDGGTYTCRVSNRVGQGEASAPVEVIVIPPQGVITVSFSGVDHTVRESTGYVTIEIQASQSFPEASTVTVQTQDGTAVDGMDYRGGNFSVRFPIGETQVSFNITIIDDDEPPLEEEEQFSINFISVPSGASPEVLATVTIQDDCTRECQNGGTLDSATCLCTCPARYTGLSCENCVAKDCMNGGTQNSTTCNCVCLPAFSGEFCEDCVGKNCMNGGRQNSTTCNCVCPPTFSGELCEECVETNCMNGGTHDPDGCVCICPPEYTGELCEDCAAKNCMNGGTQNSTTCNCVCLPAFSGELCEDCVGKNCMNGGTQNSTTCNCVCLPAFSGEFCEECAAKNCMNGGTLNSSTCDCVCPPEYTGELCEECVAKNCMNGGTLNSSTCDCVCPPEYTGEFCEECVETNCMNGGTHDSDACVCICPPEYTGELCEVVISSTPVVASGTPVVALSTQVEVSSTSEAVMTTTVETTSTILEPSSIPVEPAPAPSSAPAFNSTSPVITSSIPLVTSSTPVVVSSTPVVTSITPFVAFMASTPGVAASTPDVTSSILLLDSVTPHFTPPFTPDTPVINSSIPVDVSSTPFVNSSTPVVTTSAPTVTSVTLGINYSIPDTTFSTPFLTSIPASSSARPFISPTPSPSVDLPPPIGVSVSTPRVSDEPLQITLMWSRPELDSELTGYQIQYSWESRWDPSQFVKRQSEPKTMSVQVDDTATSYTLQDAEGFAKYCFEVSALYEGGMESPAATEMCTNTSETKPTPPRNLSQVGSSVTTSSVQLQWDAPDPPNGNITHFKVYYQPGGAPRQYQVSDWHRQGYVVLDGLDPNTEYYINVTAVTGTSESNTSNVLRVVTLSGTGIAGWVIAVIVIVLLILICIIVAVVMCCVVYFVLARRAGKYDVPEAEKTSKVNYVVEMDELESLQLKEGMHEHSPAHVTTT